MEIKATSTFDKETITKFTFESLSRKGSAKKKATASIVVFTVLTALVVLEMIIFGTSPMMFALLGLCAFCILLEAFLFFIYPSTRYKSLCNMKDVRNEFVFTDDGFTVASKNDTYSGNAELRYAMVARVVETDGFFYIYQDKIQAYIVQKSTFSGGTPTELAEKLKTYCGKKYEIRKA